MSAQEFRVEAQHRGLLVTDKSSERLYIFGLNAGEITTRQDTRLVWDLVHLARDYAVADSDGEHNALLRMIARKSDLGQPRVNWESPWYSGKTPGEDIADWQSIRNLLEERGYNLREIYRDGK